MCLHRFMVYQRFNVPILLCDQFEALHVCVSQVTRREPRVLLGYFFISLPILCFCVSSVVSSDLTIAECAPIRHSIMSLTGEVNETDYEFMRTLGWGGLYLRVSEYFPGVLEQWWATNGSWALFSA